MRVSQMEMEKNHARIVGGAARLMRERGIDGITVADVMSEAGLTHGGFYRHFETKDALAVAALQSAFNKFGDALEAQIEILGPERAVSGFQSHYLSRGHVDNPGIGCPAAALGLDVGRGPEALKNEFGAGVKRMIEILAKAMRGTKQQKREKAARRFAMLAGAVMIARASDPETARLVLLACEKHAVP